MPRKSIRASEILKDIMSGMGDTGLMEKYDLSARVLLKIMSQVCPRVRSPCDAINSIPVR